MLERETPITHRSFTKHLQCAQHCWVYLSPVWNMARSPKELHFDAEEQMTQLNMYQASRKKRESG